MRNSKLRHVLIANLTFFVLVLSLLNLVQNYINDLLLKKKSEYYINKINNGQELTPADFDQLDDIGAFLNIIFDVLDVILIFVLMYKFYKSIVSHIEQINNDVKEIERGNLNKKVTIVGNNELTDLSKSINNMAKTLKFNIDNTEKLYENISHDLKTPVSVTKLYLHAMRDKMYSNDDELQEYIKKSLASLDEVNELSNKVLELKTYDRDKNEVIDFTEITSLINDHKSTLSLKNYSLQLSNQIEGSINEVNCSKEVIKSAFNNLVSNFIKYSTSNDLYVELKIVSHELSIKFINTADDKTIAESDKLLERFYRVDDSRTTKGNGLGLNIVKESIEAFGGKVKVNTMENNICFEILLSYK